MNVAGDITIEDGWDWHRNYGRAALDADCDGNIEIVDLTVSVEVGKGEVGGEDDCAAAEDVDQAMCGVVLEFSRQSQRVGSQCPCEGVAELIAVERGGLWQVEVCAVCKIGEDEFVGEAKLRICGGRVLREWGNVVVEVVVVEGEIVDASGREDSCYAGQERVEAIERVLAFGCGKGWGGLRWCGLALLFVERLKEYRTMRLLLVLSC